MVLCFESRSIQSTTKLRADARFSDLLVAKCFKQAKQKQDGVKQDEKLVEAARTQSQIKAQFDWDLARNSPA